MTTHGRSGYRRGCRCGSCVRAMRVGSKADRITRELRRWREPVWRVGTTAVRRHVEELRRHGWTYARIASTTGLSVATVYRVTVADRCTNRVERRLLAVAP